MLDHVGYVPFENLVGKARVIFFSVEEDEPIWKVWGMAVDRPLGPDLHHAVSRT